MAHKTETLDALWEYIDTFHPYACDEEKRLTKELAEKSAPLTASFNREQIALFENYSECLSQLRIAELREAFKKGVKFATGYILESRQ